MDADYSRNLDRDGAPTKAFAPSLYVWATVMNRPAQDRAIADAGLKALAFDPGRRSGTGPAACQGAVENGGCREVCSGWVSCRIIEMRLAKRLEHNGTRVLAPSRELDDGRRKRPRLTRGARCFEWD